MDPATRHAPLSVSADGVAEIQQLHQELVNAARPVMKQATEFLSQSGTAMVLTDPAGVIIGMEGDPATLDNGQDIHLMLGAHWDERVSGTNAIGTALATGQPVQILSAEHFCEGIKHWTCSAMVVRDPYDERILGVLDISGLSGAHNSHCLALVCAGAARIEGRLAKIEIEKRSRLLDLTLDRASRWLNDGIMIFDRRRRLVRANEAACEALNAKGIAFDTAANLFDTGDGRAEPILDNDELLGTVLVLPARPVPQRAERRRAEADDGDVFGRIIGSGPAILKAKAKARQLARVHVPVLLLGPTGAGKEVFARALHESGAGQGRPFVPLNCGGMTRELLASELFGYVDGAFTGARRGGMLGKFEAADGGTLFLDEIGEMPIDLQAHFLRVLEDSEVYRLGENKPRKIKVRLVAATNRDLRDEVAKGRFRMDLFYRLSVTVLNLPSLRERAEDIPLLVQHFIEKAAERYGVPAKRVEPSVIATLCGHAWPGNVRELRNVVEGMLLLSEGEVIAPDDLPAEIGGAPAAFAPAVPAPRAGTVPTLEENERQSIITAISRHGGNLTRTAESLGIAKSTLYQKMKRYNLDRNPDAGP
ncbi:transcriptional regulator of acetoin/glycerol metabolism [Azospirillum fermentarium]|uniref:sigma-54-dependent Fis family transcriptional regulator n=1 Tax=Azospirillum fermentarium TaxID=1233114 RepID=UPI002226C37E|nr:sigma-54-dependent Fis family transcriptional regulator [Azospirillum fermentarium]MCW2249038.1 transcriptional regulator of acetoin/glycerol metabolism [Azospirillum fermentarium]